MFFRLWTKADIDYVTGSVRREGWGYVRRDIERCWQYEPDGCFIAEVEDKPVGHVFSVCYGRVGWIGLLIVDPERRGKGIGASLMQKAIDYLQGVGAETIRLEAAEKAAPLYRRLGFRDEFDSLRFCKQLKSGKKPRRSAKNVFPMQEEDIERIAEFDSVYFGSNRLRVLQSLYRDEPEHCFVVRERQRMLGYLMGRKVSGVHRVGPWVCKSPDAAEKLLDACTKAVGKEEAELRLGMPVVNEDGLGLLKKSGFQQTSRSIRMVLGKRGYEGNAAGVYGIGGPEKG